MRHLLLRSGITFATLLAVACLKGGTTGTPGTDDTGVADDTSSEGGTSTEGHGSPSASGTTEDNDGDAATPGKKGGTAKSDSGASGSIGKPGDPCVTSAECDSKKCSPATKTCDGCVHAGESCANAGDCCLADGTAEGVKVFCGQKDGLCTKGKKLNEGDLCDSIKDPANAYNVCPAPSTCTGTGSYGKGEKHCTIQCTADTQCKTDLHGPVCNPKSGFCGQDNCTKNSQCSTSVGGHLCVFVSNRNRCGCKADTDCQGGATCHANLGQDFAYCW